MQEFGILFWIESPEDVVVGRGEGGYGRGDSGELLLYILT